MCDGLFTLLKCEKSVLESQHTIKSCVKIALEKVHKK